MSPIKQFNNLPGTIKSAIAIGVSLLTFVGGVWAFDDRYVDQGEAITTLKQYNMQIQQQIAGQEQEFKARELERLTEQYYLLKRMSRMYPDDQELLEELEIVKERRERMRESLNAD